MPSAQSKKATVMSCRQSQVRRAASVSCVFTQSQVTSPLGGKQKVCGGWEAVEYRCVQSSVCRSDPLPTSQSGQGMSKQRGRARLNTRISSLERGHYIRAPAGGLAEGLTCMPCGSAPGPGPGPQAVCATRAPARSGREVGATPLENGAAGLGRQGAGSVAGPWRRDGVRVSRECILALKTQFMWGCTFPITQPLGRPALLTSLSLAYSLGEAGEAVTEPGKVRGTVGRKEADCGTGVFPG